MRVWNWSRFVFSDAAEENNRAANRTELLLELCCKSHSNIAIRLRVTHGLHARNGIRNVWSADRNIHDTATTGQNCLYIDASLFVRNCARIAKDRKLTKPDNTALKHAFGMKGIMIAVEHGIVSQLRKFRREPTEVVVGVDVENVVS